MKKEMKWIIKTIQTGQEDHATAQSPVSRYFDQDGEQQTNGFSVGKLLNGMEVVNLTATRTSKIKPSVAAAVDHMVDEKPLAKVGPKLRVKATEVLRQIGEDFKEHLAEDSGDGCGKRIVFRYADDISLATPKKTHPAAE